MTVLFSLTYYTPYVSGLTLCVSRLAEALVRRGHRVTVLTMQHDPTLQRHESVRTVRVMRATPIARISKGFLSLDWFRLAWSEVRDNDVVVVNLPQGEGWFPALVGKLMGKRVIAVYHCEVILPETFMNSVLQAFLELANSVTLLLADAVVTYTRDFAKHSRILTPFLGKTTYIYPPVPIPAKKQSVTGRLRKKIGRPDVVIGVAARLAAEKGIEYLFEAIPLIQSKVENLKLKIVLAGPMEPVGEGAYKEKILVLVRKYKKHIVFLGTIKPEEMGSFYSFLDVLVLPSVNSTEAFGIVQVEAMLSGVPVVASDLPGVRVPIQKTGMGILAPPRNAGAIAYAIGQILQKPENFRSGQADIRHIFRFDDSVSTYEKLFSR
jgi:glycosyltransferase involved in cell wall biosynthesis